jgi:hypothetical protein
VNANLNTWLLSAALLFIAFIGKTSYETSVSTARIDQALIAAREKDARQDRELEEMRARSEREIMEMRTRMATVEIELAKMRRL